MTKPEAKLKKIHKEVEHLSQEINLKIEEIGEKTSGLVNKLSDIQKVFDSIRGWSNEEKLTLENLRNDRFEWTQQVEKLKSDYKLAETKTVGGGVVGVGAGVAVVTLGPTIAMGIATTFGVASTGTAISALSGAAATNAALAWLGGGTIALGGGGIAAGNALLLLSGPVGWTMAGATLLGSGTFFLMEKNKVEILEDIYTHIGERDIKAYKLSILEINERINRIVEESELLAKAKREAISYGTSYNTMTEEQQIRLITFVNLMNSSTQLLINPILGLQAKITEKNLIYYFDENPKEQKVNNIQFYLMLTNLLYDVDLNKSKLKRLWRFLRGNKEFIRSIGISKKDFTFTEMHTVQKILSYKYNDF